MSQGNRGWNKRAGWSDTSDLPQVLARLQKENPPPGAEVVELSRQAASTRESGFFDRLLEEHFLGSNFPRKLKDVTKSLFGLPSQEDTVTWGQSGDLSIPAGVISPALLGLIPRPQMVHVHRERPVTFTILAVVDFGPGFTGVGGENIGVQFEYTIGVGQQRVLVKRTLPVLADGALFNGAQQIDVFQTPLAALQVQARLYDITLLGVETPQRTITATVLSAPVVQ